MFCGSSLINISEKLLWGSEIPSVCKMGASVQQIMQQVLLNLYCSCIPFPPKQLKSKQNNQQRSETAIAFC